MKIFGAGKGSNYQREHGRRHTRMVKSEGKEGSVSNVEEARRDAELLVQDHLPT